MPERNVASIRPYGDESERHSIHGYQESFRSSSRSVLSDQRRAPTGKAQARLQQFVWTGQAPTFFRSARSSLVPEPFLEYSQNVVAGAGEGSDQILAFLTVSAVETRQ
jgi:hypothetical protein